MHQITEESGIAGRLERDAERYYNKYKSYMTLLEDESALSRVRRVTPYDFYALGKQLESFEYYRNICEEDGTVSQLGKIPE